MTTLLTLFSGGPSRAISLRTKLGRWGCAVLLLCVAIFFGLRWLERAITYHPVAYKPSAAWTLPANGEDVWLTAVDGNRLHGWLVRAASPSGQSARATVLYLHGNAGNVTNVGWVASALAQEQLDVLAIDYRGYGRSGGQLTDESGLNADGLTAYEYLTRERGVAPQQIVLYGLSLGSSVAVDVAAKRPCGALIVESGMSSASELAATAAPFVPHWLHWIGRNRFPSAQRIANVHAPVLILHGERDDVIPFAHGQRLFAAANHPKEFIAIPGGNHNLVGNGGIPYLKRIADFIHAQVPTRK